jgi:hypothetical protein
MVYYVTYFKDLALFLMGLRHKDPDNSSLNIGRSIGDRPSHFLGNIA